MSCRFRWVSLQIDNLCDPERMNHEHDVEQELGRLPRTLQDSYRIIHDRIEVSGPISRKMAHRVISWLLCARYSLVSHVFIDAVSVDSEGNRCEVSRRDLLNMCCNLVVWDQATDHFRFAHLSVQEYFQSQLEYSREKINEVAVTRCVNVFIARVTMVSNPEYQLELGHHSANFLDYATLYWPYHCDASGSPNCRGMVQQFLFQESEIASPFKIWTSIVKQYSEDILGVTRRSFMRSETLHYRSYREICHTICTPPTPLLIACWYGWNEILEILSTFSDVDWNQRDDSGTKSALRLALRRKDLRTAEFLLKQGADVHVVDLNDKLLLFEATSRRHSEAVKLLLDTGSDVNAVDSSGRSALHSLGLEGNYDITIARMLLSGGADSSLVDNEGKTALQHLCDRFDDRFDAPHVIGYSTLGLERPAGGVEGINLFLSRVTNIYEPGYDALQIIRIAAVNGFADVARGLLRAKYQINSVDSFGSTALQVAALSGQPDIVKLLLTVESVDLNLANYDGWTPLRSATWACQREITAMLIEAGTDIDSHVEGGSSALFQAAEGGNVQMLQMLLDAGADVNLDISSKGAASRRKSRGWKS